MNMIHQQNNTLHLCHLDNITPIKYVVMWHRDQMKVQNKTRKS